VLIVSYPRHFSPAVLGAEECPNTGSPTMCANPTIDNITPAGVSGNYSFTLSPGSYNLAGFYELQGGGPKFMGGVAVVTVKSSQTTGPINLQVPYKVPATLTGKITIKNVPKSDPVSHETVLVCPSSEPFNGSTPAEDCLTGGAKATKKVSSSGSISDSGTYSVTGFPAGSYIAYPGYNALSGSVTSTSGTAVTLTAGHTTTQNLKTNFLMGTQGLVFGKVSVTGAPAGFSPQLGAQACSTTSSSCAVAFEQTGKSYNLIVNAGSYNVRGFYLTTGGDFVYGSAVPEVVTAGAMIHAHLTVAYTTSAANHK
jgi:hypothetical protein